MGKWVHRLSDIDEESWTATCAECGPGAPLRRRHDGWRCETSYRETRGTRGPNARQRGRILLGDRFDEVFAEQGGRCAICSEPMDPACADHCHERDAFRGLLCRDCNLGLGRFHDNPERLRQAAEYLERFA